MHSLIHIFLYVVGFAIYSLIGVGFAMLAMPKIKTEAFKARRDSGNFMPWFEVILGTIIATIWPMFLIIWGVGMIIAFMGEP